MQVGVVQRRNEIMQRHTYFVQAAGLIMAVKHFISDTKDEDDTT